MVNKNPRGIRVNMPSGYLLGRASKGSGRAELIRAKGLVAGGGGSGGGGGGGGSGGLPTATTAEQLGGSLDTVVSTPLSVSALWAKAADVASATSVSIGDGGFFHVTGTVTITAFAFTTDTAGRTAWLKFDGILTLTHNATSLILPNNGSNITTAAGDTCVIVSEGSGNVRCLAYQRANGQALQSSVSPGAISLTNAHILVGNGSNVAADVAMSGDATMTNTGALTIANAAVTLANIQNAAASSKLLGSGSSGLGSAYVELSLGSGLSMSGTTLSASASGGSGIYEANGTKPVVANFTLENAGTASMADGTFGIVLTAPSATLNLRFVRSNTAPNASFTMIYRTSALAAWDSSAYGHGYAVLRNSTAARIITLGRENNTLALNRWSAYTTISTTPLSIGWAMAPSLGWFKVTGDGTTLTFYGSSNGADWGLLTTELYATYLTAAGGTLDQCGFGCLTNNGSQSIVDCFESFTLT